MKKILLYHTDQHCLLEIWALLEKHFQVDIAMDAQTAKNYYLANKYDIIIVEEVNLADLSNIGIDKLVTINENMVEDKIKSLQTLMESVKKQSQEHSKKFKNILHLGIVGCIGLFFLDLFLFVRSPP